MSSIFISLPKTVKNIMSGKLGILYKLLVPLQFVILCSHDASKVISSRIHPCVKRYLPESIHVRKVNYQNTFMCQILFTRIHPCVESNIQESIHMRQKLFTRLHPCVKLTKPWCVPPPVLSSLRLPSVQRRSCSRTEQMMQIKIFVISLLPPCKVLI